MLLEDSLKLDIDKLAELFDLQWKNYARIKKKALLILSLKAVVLIVISMMLFVFSSLKYHFFPWNFMTGIVGMYFLIMVITTYIRNVLESKKLKTETLLYLEGIQKIQSVSYKIDEDEIKYYEDEKHKLTVKWSDLSGVIEAQGYFCLLFTVNPKNILIPKFTVTTEFYNKFLAHGKSLLGEEHVYKM